MEEEKQNKTLDAVLDLLKEEQAQNKLLREQIEKLLNQVDKFQRLLFGVKSERQKAKGNDNKKAPEDEDDGNPPPPGGKTSKSTQPPARKGRRGLPDDMKRTDVTHELAESERVCHDCQGELRYFGIDFSEQLDFVPTVMRVLRHCRHKYACCDCHKVIAAPLPAAPIEKGLPTASLLAEVLINKYDDHLPLYRQQKRWKRLGYEISRSTLCDWDNQTARLLKPLVVAMTRDSLLNSPKIHADDTTIPVLDPGKGKTHTGRIWAYLGGDENGPRCVVYQYSKTRKKEVSQEFLGNYAGFLQVDAYPGFNILFEDGRVIEVACWAHARRKFHDIVVSVKEPTLAHVALEWIAKLYEVEANAKKLSRILRYYYRRFHAKPILKRFRRWLLKYKGIALPKSLLGNAINYTLNHWLALNNYLRSGLLDIDNNAAERAIKPVVLGRKNYLFAGSHEGAENTAIIYSLIETCKLWKINTYAYLKDVLERLPSTLMKHINQLLPYNWQPAA